MRRAVVDTEAGKVSWEEVGDGPHLVVLHSLLTDRHAFDPVVGVLSDHWTVDLVDLPGFGESAPAGPEIDAYADAVGGFLRARELDPSTTALMGNGLGGFVALGTAIRYGDLLSRLCLVGCGAAFGAAARETFRTMADRVEEGGMDSVLELAVRRIFPERYLEENPEVARERRDVLMRTRPSAFVAACRALSRVDYRRQAGMVANPTLILVGTEDGATPPAMARELHALIPGSDLVEMEAVGHAPQLQDPEGFVRASGEFLLGRQ
ncbi:MAG: alpha/beta fold hydrolase [Actinomycetota bacterium]